MGQVELPTPHWEALTPETQQAFHKIAGLEFIDSFYLAGGTGLALHLGHRFSVDLDFFSSDAEAVVDVAEVWVLIVALAQQVVHHFPHGYAVAPEFDERALEC